MAQSTPTRPLELPPYSLVPLLHPVFPPSSSRPTSPSKQRPSSPQQPQSTSRLGQLASAVAAGAGAAAAAAGSVAGGAGGAPAEGSKQAVLKSVDAGEQRVWLGASDGKIRMYEVGDDEGAQVPSGLLSPTPGSPGRRTPVKPQSALEFLDEVVVTPTKKAADRIALLPRLDKAILLSEGIMTFHSLPALTPLNVQSFPSIRGVATFAVDENELAGGGSPDAMHVVAIKRRTVHWLKVTNEGVTSVKDLPLRGGALVSVLRKNHICIADAENYSIVDLVAAEALPLLPISQVPHPDPLPTPSSSAAAGGAATPPAPGGPDPRQRPAIACVGENEFLVASHTGSTTLGVFVNELGEPCRGTLEWASNCRSLVVDSQYSIALLHNNTIEIHSIHSQEIVQVVQLPVSSSVPPSPLSFQPRSLAKSWMGLELGHATGANKLEVVSVPLLPYSASPSSSSARPEPPSTPTRRSRASISSASIRSGLTTATSSSSPSPSERPTTTRVLVVGRNGLYALTPLTLVIQADALIERGREEDAMRLAEEWEKSAVGGVAANPDLSYVYLRLAYLSLARTAFQESFALFLRAGADPRLVVRMFPDLREPLMSGGSGEEVEVVRGLREEVRAARTVDEYVLDNLNRNYSPHLQPSVEHAASTVELRASLAMTARDCLLSYLMKWRALRRDGGEEGEGLRAGMGDSRKVDMVVDTTLVRLLAEQSRPADITVLLTSGAHDVVLPAAESSLLSARLYWLLSRAYLERGEERKALELWRRCVEGELEPPEEGEGGEEDEDLRGDTGVRKVFDLVWRMKDKEVTEKYGLWMLRHDRDLGLKLFIDPKQTLTFDTRDLFAKMSTVDGAAADNFLESVVLQERDADSRLHADLVKRYIGRLGEILTAPEAKAHLREQESAYISLTSSTSTPPTFLSFLTSRYSPSSPFAELDRVRLKALLFLGASSKYDVQGAKKELEEMEMRGERGLVLERVVVYGKLRLDRQALSLLLHTLHDLPSAETYSLQSGDPLLPSEVAAAASTLALPTATKKARKALSAGKREEEERRKEGLARLLVEMCLAEKPAGAEEGREPKRVASEEQVARLLETQALHLDTLEVLPLIPPTFPLHLLTPYLSRSLRRSLHSQQEANILKSLASAQNFAVSEAVYELQSRRGPVVDLTSRPSGGGGAREGGEKGEKVVVVEKAAAEGDSVGEKATAAPALEEAVELDLR
ncbi:hypothetical protein JCM8097_007301 [Rhodosporidiobolus ruineniae]